MLHQDRRRAGSFGEDAELYDRARPTYPAEMIDDLMAESPRRVLDVGCGTGIAGRLLAARGCDVLGVEPDGRMAAVARRHGLAVEDATFEDWASRGRTFDLIVCGQAWHWVDPAAGPAKAAEILGPGGRLALFWNHGRHDHGLHQALEDVYRQVAPDLEKYSILLRNLGDQRLEETAASLGAAGCFDPPAVRTYAWTQTYTRDEWIDHLMTHSDHRTMEAQARRVLFDGISRAIDRFGGLVPTRYQCSLVITRKAAG